MCVPQVLRQQREKELNNLSSTLTFLYRTNTVVLQWMLPHCNRAIRLDALAKEGRTKKQEDRSTTFKDAKVVITARQAAVTASTLQQI